MAIFCRLSQALFCIFVLTPTRKILHDSAVSTINLYEYALAKAKESATRRELVKVSRESGLDYSWLSKFALERIPGASYQKVDQLARYYMGEPLPPQSPPANLQQGAA
jgi:hypothetical protein